MRQRLKREVRERIEKRDRNERVGNEKEIEIG